MRSRRLRNILAATLALSALWTSQLAAPSLVGACSCRRIDNPDIVKAAAWKDSAVFIGVVTAMDRPGLGQHDLGDMKILRVYKGDLPEVARVRGGGGGDCSFPLAVGLRMLWVAPYENDVLDPGLCGVHGDPDTPEGRHLVALAEAAFGPGTVPGAPADTVPAPDPAELDLASLAIGLVGALILGIIVVVAVAGRRRPERQP